MSPDEKPINQSERNDVYVDAAKKIFDSGNAYWCDCSKEELEEMRKQQEKDGKKPMYDGRSRNKGLKQSENTVLRLATPEDGEIVVNDLIRGKVVFQNSELDDLILLRSDGTPTYHLCNVVDDFEQNVTTVIRGEDHLSNTPRQIHIQNALGYPALEYAHLPLVLGPDKRRLSKRHAATSLEEYKSDGYLDSAILNTLARLGWSKGDQEVFYMEDLIRDFNIRDVQKAGAIFDITKLDWLNTQHIANLSFEDFKKELEPFLHDLSIDIENHQNVDLLLSSMRTAESTFKKIADDLIPYYFEVNTYNQQAIDKFLDDEGLKILIDLSGILLSIDEWSENNIDTVLKSYQNENNYPVPKVNQPIRIALTGSTKSPSLGLTLAIFGKSEALKRINNLIDYIR